MNKETSYTMAFHTITLSELPSKTISVQMLRSAFEKCTPYDCPSRMRLNSCYPVFSWDRSPLEDISMEHVSRVLLYCLGSTEYIDRFALYFTGECVAGYDVLHTYFTQTFVRT
jgi:hypothetical protein